MNLHDLLAHHGMTANPFAPDEEDLGGLETGDLRLDIRYAPEPAVVEEDFEGESLEE